MNVLTIISLWIAVISFIVSLLLWNKSKDMDNMHKQAETLRQKEGYVYGLIRAVALIDRRRIEQAETMDRTVLEKEYPLLESIKAELQSELIRKQGDVETERRSSL